jgi:RNA polymerase sigma factor FliA
LRYVRAVDGRARAQLVERHLDLARRAAALLHPRVRDHVALDELVALANAGLAEAASQYDPARGASFATFAWYRVNGAIVDGLRKAAPLPRRTWARLVALRAANEYLENLGERERGATGRGAQPATGATQLAAVGDALAAIRTIYLTSLEALPDRGHDVASDGPAPPDHVEAARLAERLRAALTALPERERALMTKHYWEGKNLLEAGAELGISKSWASRLHAQAVDRLRAALDDPPRRPRR